MSFSSTLSLLRNNSPVHLVSSAGNLAHPPLSRPLHLLRPSSECTHICPILSILPPMLVQSHHVSPRPLQWFPNWSLFQLLWAHTCLSSMHQPGSGRFLAHSLSVPWPQCPDLSLQSAWTGHSLPPSAPPCSPHPLPGPPTQPLGSPQMACPQIDLWPSFQTKALLLFLS